MPLTPHNSGTFLHALSDFWPLYFQDQDVLRAYAEGLSLNIAQLYQRLLESVLGTNLLDAPSHSKVFYRPYYIRESDVRYREGAAPDDDRYVVDVADGLADGAFLTNRVICPTDALLVARDFSIEPSALVFHRDPFAGALSNFPERTVTVTHPAAWRDPLDRAWSAVQPGDTLRWTIGQAQIDSLVQGAVGATLYLSTAPPGVSEALARRGGKAVVLRTPYDDSAAEVRLSDHPTSALRLSPDVSDGTSVANSREVLVSGLSNYRGAWAATTAYVEGDLVTQGGTVWRCLVDHTSPGVFSATPWDDLTTGYFYVQCAGTPRYTQLVAADTPSTGGRIAIAAGLFTTATALTLYRVRYNATTGPRPRLTLPHAHQLPGTLVVSARRLVAHTQVDPQGVATVYPAGEGVREGVDYTFDPDSGALVVHSLWDPALYARASYRWRLEVARRMFLWRGAYTNATLYNEGDLVLSGGVVYVIARRHTSDGVLASDTYIRLREPVTLEVARSVREYAVWLTDALIDEQTLARNFGSLLLREEPSSEAQRAFLFAASRLFLLGPSFSRITSALHAILGLPLVRENQELLLGYTSGVDVSSTPGSGARTYGTGMGLDGALTVSGATFTSASASFLSTDVGSALRVLQDGVYQTYTVLTVVNATSVTVAPTPFGDATALVWELHHEVFANRLRIAPTDYTFTESDLGRWVRLRGTQPRNQGVFQIIAVDDPFTVELDTPYSLVDEAEVGWDLSVNGVQRVTTHRRTYEVPLNVPVFAALRASANWGVLRLDALSPISDAVHVDDYLTDPTWWHHIQIPEELYNGTPTQRTVTPALIEHVYGALDDAHVGDAGINVALDEQGRESLAREVTATWYGGREVVAAVTAPGPAINSRDVGQHLVLTTAGFEAAYKIERVHADGATLTLENFPPPEARGVVPPVLLAGRLPPLVFRHVVAFILMDQALKYHCVRVRLDPNVSFSPGVLADISHTLQAARPSHVFVFVEAGTVFEDSIEVDEELTLDLALNRPELLQVVESLAYISPSFLLRAGDAFRFEDLTGAFSLTPGTPVSLPVTLPAGTNVVATLVKVGFDPAARVGSRMPAEGVDYTVDPVGLTVTLHLGVVLTPDPVDIDYTVCIRRTVTLGDPLDPGEGYVAYGGSDPTIVRAPGQVATTAGLVDRTVQLTFGP